MTATEEWSISHSGTAHIPSLTKEGPLPWTPNRCKNWDIYIPHLTLSICLQDWLDIPFHHLPSTHSHMTTISTVYLELSFCSVHAAQGRGEGCYYLPSYVWVTPAIGMFGQWIKKMNIARRLDTVQSKHNLMIPEQRSLNLFTRNPPRNVPPPPAGTTR